jgi:hypothetical protein
MNEFIVYSRVNDNGQEIYRFTLTGRDSVPNVSIENNYLDTAIDCFLAMKTGRRSKGVQSVELKDGALTIVRLFLFKAIISCMWEKRHTWQKM